MIDHTGVIVSNFEHSKKFYREALAAIGYELICRISGFGHRKRRRCGFW